MKQRVSLLVVWPPEFTMHTHRRPRHRMENALLEVERTGRRLAHEKGDPWSAFLRMTSLGKEPTGRRNEDGRNIEHGNDPDLACVSKMPISKGSCGAG